MPDQTIMDQVGHILPERVKHYSHIRRQALNVAAAALEPAFTLVLERRSGVPAYYVNVEKAMAASMARD